MNSVDPPPAKRQRIQDFSVAYSVPCRVSSSSNDRIHSAVDDNLLRADEEDTEMSIISSCCVLGISGVTQHKSLRLDFSDEVETFVYPDRIAKVSFVNTPYHSGKRGYAAYTYIPDNECSTEVYTYKEGLSDTSQDHICCWRSSEVDFHSFDIPDLPERDSNRGSSRFMNMDCWSEISLCAARANAIVLRRIVLTDFIVFRCQRGQDYSMLVAQLSCLEWPRATVGKTSYVFDLAEDE